MLHHLCYTARHLRLRLRTASRLLSAPKSCNEANIIDRVFGPANTSCDAWLVPRTQQQTPNSSEPQPTTRHDTAVALHALYVSLHSDIPQIRGHGRVQTRPFVPIRSPHMSVGRRSHGVGLA
ncbi:hypothetical protein FRC12_011830 [Ceratobasidium sp. 428]|nr:hypothetical protein FRC12_011830 [Ceratobasidium sp. 428]